MAVASGNGKGESPELYQVVGEDFSYPTSEGVPNLKWITGLYTEEGPDKDEWKPVFPTLHEKIMLSRAPWKTRLRNLTRATHIPADPMTEIYFSEWEEPEPLQLPQANTSFAVKGKEKAMPKLGTKRVLLQNRAEYVEALVARDSLNALQRTKEVLGKEQSTTLPPVKLKPNIIVVDESEREVFNIVVDTNVKCLKTLTMPLTDVQPDISWLNFLDQKNGGKVNLHTTVDSYKIVEGEEQPLPVKIVTASLVYPNKKILIAKAKSMAKAPIIRSAIVYKLYAVLGELYKHGIITSRKAQRQREPILFDVPFSYTAKEQTEIEDLSEKRELGPGSWSFETEVDEKVEHVDSVKDKGVDPYEITLLNQVRIAEGLLKDLNNTLSNIQKAKYEETRKKQERPAHAQKPSQKSSKQSSKDTTRQSHDGRPSQGNRVRFLDNSSR